MRRACVGMVLLLLLAMDGALATARTATQHTPLPAGGDAVAAGEEDAAEAHRLRFVHAPELVGTAPLSEHVAAWDSTKLVPRALPFTLDWALSERFGVAQTKRAWALFSAARGIDEQRAAFPDLFEAPREHVADDGDDAAARVELMLEMTAARAELAMHAIVSQQQQQQDKPAARTVAASVALRRPAPALGEVAMGLDAAFAAFDDEYGVIVERYGGFSADGMRAYIRDETVAQWERARRMAAVYMVGARGLNGVIDDMVANLRSLGRGTLGLAYLKGLSGSIELLHEQKRDLNDATYGPIARGEAWFHAVDTMLEHVRAGTPVDAAHAAQLERALRRWVGNYQAISDVVYTFNSGLIAELDRSIMKTTLVREVSLAIAITIVSGGLGSAAGAATAARVAHLAARTQQIVSVAVRSAVLGQRGVQLALKAGPAVVRAATLLQRGLPLLARFSTSMLSGGATKWLFTRLFAMEALLVQGNFAPEAWGGALRDKGLHEFLQGMLDGLFTGIGGKAVFGYAAAKATLAGRWMVTRMLAQAARVRYVMPAASRALFANAAHATRTWMSQVAGRGVLSGGGADRLARLRSALQRVLGDKAYTALVRTGRSAKLGLRRLSPRRAKDLSLTAVCNVFLGGVDNLVHQMVGMMSDPAWKDKTMRERLAHLQDQLYRATVGGLIIESVLLLGQPFMPLARRGAMRELFAGDHSGLVRESLVHTGSSSGALRKQLDDLFVAAMAGGGKNAAGNLVADAGTAPPVPVPAAADVVYVSAASLGTAAHVPTWTKTNALLDVGVWRTVHGLAAQMTILAYMKRPHETPSFADVLHMERVAMDVLGLRGITVNDRVARIVYAFVVDSIDDMRTSVFAEQVPVLREVLRMGVAEDELAWRLVRDALHIVEEAGPAAASLVDDVARVLSPNAQYPDGCRSDAECSLALRALASIRTRAAGDVAAAYLRTAVKSREARGVLAAVRALHAVATAAPREGAEALRAETRLAYAAAVASVFDTRLPRYSTLRDDHAAVLQMLLGMGDDAVRHVLPTVLAWATDKAAYFSLRSRQYRREVGALLRTVGGVAAGDRASAAALVEAYMVLSHAKARAEHMWAIGRMLSGLGADALTTGVRADVLRHMRSTVSRSGPRFAVDMLLGVGSHDALVMLAHGAVMPDAHVAVVLDEMRSDDTADIIDTFLVPLLMELVNKGDAASAAARAYLTSPRADDDGGDKAHPNRVAAAKCLGWLVEADVIASMWRALPALPTPDALARGAVDVAAADHFKQHLLVVDAMWAHAVRLQNGDLHWSDDGREQINEQLALFVEPLGHVLALSKSTLFADPHATPPLPILSLLRRALFTLGYIGQPAIRLAPEVMHIMQTVDSARGTVRSLIGHAADALIHWVKRVDDDARLRKGASDGGDEQGEQHVLHVDTAVLLQALANAAERAGTKHEWVATDMCGSMRWLPMQHTAPMEATVQQLLDAHPNVALVQSRCAETLRQWRKARGSETTR